MVDAQHDQEEPREREGCAAERAGIFKEPHEAAGDEIQDESEDGLQHKEGKQANDDDRHKARHMDCQRIGRALLNPLLHDRHECASSESCHDATAATLEDNARDAGRGALERANADDDAAAHKAKIRVAAKILTSRHSHGDVQIGEERTGEYVERAHEHRSAVGNVSRVEELDARNVVGAYKNLLEAEEQTGAGKDRNQR